MPRHGRHQVGILRDDDAAAAAAANRDRTVVSTRGGGGGEEEEQYDDSIDSTEGNVLSGCDRSLSTTIGETRPSNVPADAASRRKVRAVRTSGDDVDDGGA